MFHIGKRWTFDAAHQLHGLPAHHKCARLHGHTYTVELQLQAEYLDQRGFVFDYGDLSPIKQWIDDTLDHRFLNDVLEQPTAELLAEYLFGVFSDLLDEHGLPGAVEVEAVTVRETPNTWATYRP